MGGSWFKAMEADEVHPLAPIRWAVYRPGPAWLGAGVPAGASSSVTVDPALGTAVTQAGFSNTVDLGWSTPRGGQGQDGDVEGDGVAWTASRDGRGLHGPHHHIEVTSGPLGRAIGRPRDGGGDIGGGLHRDRFALADVSMDGPGLTETTGEACSITVTSRLSVQVPSTPTTVWIPAPLTANVAWPVPSQSRAVQVGVCFAVVTVGAPSHRVTDGVVDRLGEGNC